MPLRKGASAKCTKVPLPEGKRKCGATLQGVAKCKVERLPRGGKHKASKPPPEVLPQRGKRNPEVLSHKRKLECPEVPPQRGRREPEALLPDGKHERGMTLQGNLNKAKREPDQLP